MCQCPAPSHTGRQESGLAPEPRGGWLQTIYLYTCMLAHRGQAPLALHIHAVLQVMTFEPGPKVIITCIYCTHREEPGNNASCAG